MNNIHDLGGMQGFGRVEPEENEPVFHTAWEAKAMALTVAIGAWGKWNIDASRHAREKLGPREYLDFTYYERWIAALADLMVEHGLVSEAELANAAPDPDAQKAAPPLDADAVLPMLLKGSPVMREIDAAPAFRPGDSVRARNINPAGHTRLPRYARGKTGEVVTHHGAHVFPDSNAHFQGEAPQHLYAVRFTARELWGEDAPAKDTVTLDLWESYFTHV